MKLILSVFVIASFCTSLFAADTGLTASSLKLKVFKMAVSTSPLCTNLVTVLDNGSSPTEVDFLASPDLGNGTVADGTYPCVVIEFTDIIKFKPSATSDSGNCVSSTEYQLDICRNDNNGTSKLTDGTTTTCGAQGTADRVALYLSTGAAGDNEDAFNPPTSIGDTQKGINLTSALVVAGTTSGKFIVNPAGKVCDTNAVGCAGGGGGTDCEMEAPVFGFSKL